MKDFPLRLTVNGIPHSLIIRAHHTLLDVLRSDLELTGTKEGCRMGDCGACTVLLDGQPATACLVLAPEADGRDVITIEGLACDGELHPLQAAFVQHGALQCGYCTPGMVMSAYAFVSSPHEEPPTEAGVRAALAGNVCRCTGYAKIVEAILAVCHD